jgi:ABC-type nickel/cobalt efflux system permease component RcnA
VLLVAINTNQVALGLLLIVAFSMGLASVLTALGLMVVYGKGLLGRLKLDSVRLRGGALLGRLPMASALAVSCLGLLIAFSSITTR